MTNIEKAMQEPKRLLPCPFCGSGARLATQSGPYWQWSVFVRCSNCNARSVPSVYGNNGTIAPEACSDDGRDEAVAYCKARWNMRAIALGGIVDVRDSKP